VGTNSQQEAQVKWEGRHKESNIWFRPTCGGIEQNNKTDRVAAQRQTNKKTIARPVVGRGNKIANRRTGEDVSPPTRIDMFVAT